MSFDNVGENFIIVIVDNGSKIPIATLLNLEQFKHKVIILRSDTNVGFAKGNNIGIRYLLNNNIKYILCTNNDIIPRYKSFFNIVKETYSNNDNIAAIGPDIITLSGIHQNPHYLHRISNKEILKQFFVVHNYLPRIILHKLKKILPFVSKFMSSSNSAFYLDRASECYALHGSCIFFTPKFFEIMPGFDPNTFLYGEELILAEIIYQHKLKCFYIPSVQVLHLEDVSSKLLWGEKFDNIRIKYAQKSFRYFVSSYRNGIWNVIYGTLKELLRRRTNV